MLFVLGDQQVSLLVGDTEEWRSVRGVTCATIEARGACTADGKIGGGWEVAWGT